MRLEPIWRTGIGRRWNDEAASADILVRSLRGSSPNVREGVVVLGARTSLSAVFGAVARPLARACCAGSADILVRSLRGSSPTLSEGVVVLGARTSLSAVFGAVARPLARAWLCWERGHPCPQSSGW